MDHLRKYIGTNLAFLLPYLFVLMLLTPVILIFDKKSIHLLINSYHFLWSDHFFRNMTELGNGVTPFLLGILFLLFSFRKALKVAIAGTLAGLMIQAMKKFIFSDILRPWAVLKDAADFYTIEGLRLYSSFSFPSGHSATIFSVCLILSGFTKNNIIKFTLFIIALLVGFSRIYLSQHFLIDVYAGSIIGVLSALLIELIFYYRTARWLDHSLIELINRKTS